MNYLPAISLALLALASPAFAQPSFDQAIAPLLIERCIDCHSGAKPKGKLDLTRKSTAAKAIVGKSQSVLWQRVEAGEMPPKKPLPDKEKAVLKAWLDSGAGWGTDPIDPFRVTTKHRAGYDWWSLQPVKLPLLPKVKQADWVVNPIDRFILAKLEAEGLTPAPAADARTWIRRLHFDLVGLPPAADEVEAFAKAWDAASAKPQAAVTNAVDRLLASPHYGERWARHWLDVARFGESNGFEHDELRKNAWPYRDWVIQAINRDMPYDEFARLQIAGDVLRAGEPGAHIATGFLVAGGYDSVGQGQQSAPMKAVVRQDELEDIVGTIGQSFLGLTVHCARCHDHKFDPVRQVEYYRMTAAVAGVRHGERDVASAAARLAFEKSHADALKKLAERRAELTAFEEPIRQKILAERKKAGTPPKVAGPMGIARWDFTKSLKDEIAGIGATLHGDAKHTSEGLVLAGAGHASTKPLARPIKAKTLAAVVRLRDFQQRGGAALSVQSLDGNLFDAIVFGERDPGRWMAGSNGFTRTQDFKGPAETDDKPVHVAIVYDIDGTITGYRNGVPYGKPYKSKGTLTLAVDRANILFGLRHSPVGGNKHLTGTILRAELYDRALLPQEVAASAGIASDFVADEEIVRRLDDTAKTAYAKLKRAIDELSAIASPAAGKVLAYVAAPRPPEPTHLLDRGNPTQKGTLLAAGGVAVLGAKSDFGLPVDAPDADRRRKLAEWIANADNPLFARVMVNRLWHHHFGVGLVETPSDFGFNGARPSHPELLDWLAHEFVQSGFSVKHMHRLIVTSATYRQSSRWNAEAAKRDANNRWLWRKSPLRLEAEAVRDSILAVAGQLNLKQGGPGYQDFKLTVRGATHYYTPVETDDPALYRRSIYRTWARSGRNGLLDTLDCPDPSTVSPRRAMTTTPLQALSLMNSAFVLRMADRFAERLKKEEGMARQVTLGYELAFGRRPSEEELRRVVPVVGRHGLPVFCRALLNSSEFIYVD